MDDRRQQITRVVGRLECGDAQAASELLPLVYEELRELAHRRLAREPSDLTLQATALVHEAYLRVSGDDEMKWESRAHFFAAAAEAMRRILIERARRQRQRKRGGGRGRVPLTAVDPSSDGQADEQNERLIRLDAALEKLEAIDTMQSAIVKLRFFVGLTIDQTAVAMNASTATVNRQWTFARAWLSHEIRLGLPVPDE